MKYANLEKQIFDTLKDILQEWFPGKEVQEETLLEIENPYGMYFCGKRLFVKVPFDTNYQEILEKCNEAELELDSLFILHPSLLKEADDNCTLRVGIDLPNYHVAEKIRVFSKLRNTPKINFSQALEALKKGKKVSKFSWFNLDEYLWLLPEAVVKKEWVKDPMLLETFGEYDTIKCLSSIRKKTTHGNILTGWAPNQQELFDEDYFILENL
ncbi:MAG: DUF2829 domain-containing protein [Raineya sp.]|jgi:hypothetical protein|nr:DUF2829 domain-containing protein [Raineya sp.]